MSTNFPPPSLYGGVFLFWLSALTPWSLYQRPFRLRGVWICRQEWAILAAAIPSEGIAPTALPIVLYCANNAPVHVAGRLMASQSDNNL